MRDTLNDKLAKLHAILAHRASELEEKREKLGEAERFARERREELQTERQHVKRVHSRLGSLTKSKEFNAAVREIETLKRSSKAKEEEIAKLNEEIERFRVAVESEEAELEGNRKELAEEESRNAEELERLGGEIDDVSAELEGLEDQLAKPILRRYRRIASCRDGIAVVEVREGQCTGCNRQVQPQLRVRLLKGETLESCPVCSRYVYVPDDELHRYVEP